MTLHLSRSALLTGTLACLAGASDLAASEPNGPSISAPLMCSTGSSQSLSAHPENLDTLLASGDLVALLHAARQAGPRTSKADLLNGMAASLLLKNDAAAGLLRRYLTNSDGTTTYFAATTLAGIEMRRGRYGEALAALRRALRPEVAATASERDRRSSERFLPLLDALKGVPAQSGPSATRGEVAVTRDAAALPNADVAIEGQPQTAILDTGANLSLIVRSRALALGLRMLPDEVSVASPVAEETPAQLAVADNLTIGGTEFHNVVFMVLPDEALTFAEGRYKIEAIVGFPVLSRLGRVTFSSSDAAERMTFGPSVAPGEHAGEVNLLVDGLTPKILACLQPERVPIQLALDSGAQTTSLRPRFAAAFPQRLATTVVAEVVGGVGGAVSRETRFVPVLALTFGSGPSIDLADVSLNEEALNQPGDHGRIGQDVLRSQGGYVLDFGTMRFALIKAGD